MESTEMKAKHVYKCVGCGLEFETETFAEKCPKCRCRVLIHKSGESRRSKACGGGGCSGSCATCGGCSH